MSTAEGLSSDQKNTLISEINQHPLILSGWPWPIFNHSSQGRSRVDDRTLPRTRGRLVPAHPQLESGGVAQDAVRLARLVVHDPATNCPIYGLLRQHGLVDKGATITTCEHDFLRLVLQLALAIHDVRPPRIWFLHSHTCARQPHQRQSSNTLNQHAPHSYRFNPLIPNTRYQRLTPRPYLGWQGLENFFSRIFESCAELT